MVRTTNCEDYLVRNFKSFCWIILHKIQTGFLWKCKKIIENQLFETDVESFISS